MRASRLLSIFIFGFVALNTASAQVATTWQQIKVPPLPTWHPAEPPDCAAERDGDLSPGGSRTAAD